jgi:poly(3-hydroxybutyrate) depolymerase
MLTSIEWQGRTFGETKFEAIGEAGTMAILDRLLIKYPQIDPARVYFTGLSAGRRTFRKTNYSESNSMAVGARWRAAAR